jgi:hypothetical protein
VAVTTRRRRLENLILCGHLLEVALQSLVLERGLLLGCLEVGELGFQILDVLLFALTESSLSAVSVSGNNSLWWLWASMEVGDAGSND